MKIISYKMNSNRHVEKVHAEDRLIASYHTRSGRMQMIEKDLSSFCISVAGLDHRRYRIELSLNEVLRLLAEMKEYIPNHTMDDDE